MDEAVGVILFAAAVPCWLAVRQYVRDSDIGFEGARGVQEVLSYWFDGDINENYKHKWFPSSNKELQERADKVISERFSGLLQLALNDELRQWGNFTKSQVAKIIVLGKRVNICHISK